MDCRFVRMSSRGDATDEMRERAITPALSGTRGPDGIRGGSMTLER